MLKTKIVCTLGPSTDKDDVMCQLIQKGMNVARFNFSHGSHEEHKGRLRTLKKLRSTYDLPIAALLDTKGPEIRVKDFKDTQVNLKTGQLFTLYITDHIGDENGVSITYERLINDVSVGGKILIDDGLIEMTIEDIKEDSIVCRVMNDGVVSNKKGVNVPGANLSIPYISEKDREDIIFGIKMGFDFIAASFVRSAQDVLEVRKILEEENCDFINIISKIENLQGVDNIDEIIAVSDGIMIARGDMGVEIPFEEVPVIQKMIIKKVYNAGKQVITATQMLDSMMKNPRPTRAEATDVANAIYDGTSAIMLSGETAAGAYPVKALETMVRIAQRAEDDIDYRKRFFLKGVNSAPKVTEAISHAACTTAHDLNAKAIIAVTKSGKTARKISKYRPDVPILGCATFPHVCRQLNMSWGVTPFLVKEEEDILELFEHTVSDAMDRGYLEKGDIAVITTGVPLGFAGTTNLIKVHVAGE